MGGPLYGSAIYGNLMARNRRWSQLEGMILIESVSIGMTVDQIIDLLPVPAGFEPRTRGSIAHRILYLIETNQIQVSNQFRPRELLEDREISSEDIQQILDSLTQVLRGLMFIFRNDGGDIDDL